MMITNKDKLVKERKGAQAKLTTSYPKRFPYQLNAMLNDAESNGNEHIVSWLPCGTMFKVHKHKEFAARVMPKYCRHSQYKSFLRQ